MKNVRKVGDVGRGRKNAKEGTFKTMKGASLKGQ